jgi:hypothetical protein
MSTLKTTYIKHPDSLIDQISLTSASATFEGTSIFQGPIFFNSASISGIFPSQTGNAGKVLSTNGTTVSWEEGLPSQTGQSGKYLTTNGTSASWGVVDLSTKADINSPTFTGTPAAPTAAADTNTTRIATTAFVVGQASSTNPVALGTAAVGTSLRYARTDHVHPTTGLALLTGATFTGVVTGVSPTAAGSIGYRRVTMSTAGPSGGLDGDLWVQYS